MLECLPSMYKTLSLMPSNSKNNKENKYAGKAHFFGDQNLGSELLLNLLKMLRVGKITGMANFDHQLDGSGRAFCKMRKYEKK